MQAPPLENPFYYLDNFHQVLDWIASRYSDLLAEDEAAFIAAFPVLPQPARALFVRMVMRKGQLFRASKLNYAEIGCAMEAAQHLLGPGWVEPDPVITIDELFDLLTKHELAAAFALPTHLAAARKQEQLEALRADFSDARAFSAWWREGGDQAYRILAKPLCDRLRLIFFGNFHQDWTDFVLSNLGIYKFEQVEFSPGSRGFRNRADIDHYLALYHCRERFHAEEALEDIVRDLPEAHSENEWLAGRRDRLLFQVAQQYEKAHDWPNAHATYMRGAYPGARARAIRVLEKDEQFEAAHALLLQAEAQPESDAERQQVLRMAPRIRRKLGMTAPRQAKPPVVRLDLVLPQPGEEWWVEGIVRDHLHRDDAPVFYVENTLINSLFGLLCWRAVFCAIPGAFFHPFHRGPADLHSADFHSRRAGEFAACFAELDSGEYRATILRTFEEKSGIQSPFVAWHYLSPELLSLALDCIPPIHLRRAFERILANIKDNCTGFPDLVQFWPAEKRYHMIEVKGPGDRLQDNQLRWIDYCATHGMPVSVCYLQWE